MKRSIVAALTLVTAAGCSSETGDTTSSAAGDATTSGGGPEGITLVMDSFTVQPGEEVYKCQNFANPFGGVDAEVARFSSHMAKGSHHLLLFYREGATDDPIEDCSGLEFAPTPYSTQLPDDDVTFPEGVAALVPASTGMRLQSHYLNATGNPITAQVKVTFDLAAPGTVTAHAGVLFVVEPDINIAPHSTSVVTHDCAIPFDMNLIKAGSHMHVHGIDFQATVAGEVLYQTDTWDDPTPARFDPAKPVKGQDPLHFSCTFQNDGDQPLTFGESAATDEMCIFGAQFYPTIGDSVTIDCE